MYLGSALYPGEYPCALFYCSNMRGPLTVLVRTIPGRSRMRSGAHACVRGMYVRALCICG